MHPTHQTKKTPSETAPNPRAFAVRTGLMFQSVGCILLLGGCVLGSISGTVVTPDKTPPENWLGYLASRTPAAAWTIGVATAFVGGLALAAVGIGLQGERPSSGKLAMGTTAAMFLVFAAIAALLGLGESRWATAIVAAALAVAMLFLFLFSLRCAYLFKRFPPPRHTEATQDVLDEIRKQREQRRKYYDA